MCGVLLDYRPVFWSPTMDFVHPNDVLIVFALPSEAGDRFHGLPSNVLYTGVGKVNASYALTRWLSQRRPKLVLSFGTAGSPKFPPHSLVECTHFIQRDMDARGLGFALGETPMDPMPSVISVPRRLPKLVEGRCGSGDSFVSGHNVVGCDVVDMEAYALAKVCAKEEIPFLACKYVTDGGDESADRDWADNLPHAAAAFRDLYDQLVTVAHS